MSLDAQPRGVRRDEGAGRVAEHGLDAGEEVLLDLEVLDHGLDDEVALRELREVVVEVADAHQRRAAGVEERRGRVLRALSSPPCGEAVARRGVRLLRLGEVRRHDVEQQRLDARVGEVRGDAVPHDARAEHGDPSDGMVHTLMLLRAVAMARPGRRGSGAHRRPGCKPGEE
jgi:hypothetical protein